MKPGTCYTASYVRLIYNPRRFIAVS